MLAFNFDREESLRAFEAALRLDPDAPMLRWGVAYALGPDLNKAAVQPAMDPADYPSFSQQERQRGLRELQAGQEAVQRQLGQGGLTKAQRNVLLHDQQYILALLPVFQSGDTWGESYRTAQAAYAEALLVRARGPPWFL